MADDDRNHWFGPLVLAVWAIIGFIGGSPYPTEFNGISDLPSMLNEFFSYVGGIWFLLVLLIATVAAVSSRIVWIRYFVAALILVHFVLYVSTEVRFLISDGEEFFFFTDTRFRFFANDVRDAVVFEIIPIFGAISTLSTDFAAFIRRALRRAGGSVVTGVRKVIAWVSSPNSSGSGTNDRAVRAANRALRTSRVVEVFGGITVLLGLVAGVILIVAGFFTESCDAFGDDCGTNYYSMVLGVGVALASLVQGSFFIMIGAYVASRTARHIDAR